MKRTVTSHLAVSTATRNHSAKFIPARRGLLILTTAPLEQLVSQMAARIPDAVGELYGHTASLLRGALLRKLRPEDAEEALSDVYMKAWNHATGYSESKGTVRAWLLTITRNTAIDRLRQDRTGLGRGSMDSSDASLVLRCPGPSPETRLQDNQRHSQICALLIQLSASQRQVIVMVYFHGLTHMEIADILGEPLGTIKSRIRKALLRLRVLIKGQALMLADQPL